MDFKIEYLKKEELDQYRDLMKESFGSVSDIEDYKKSYKEDSENYKILVAKDGERVIGALTFYKIDMFAFEKSYALQIFNVAVLSEYRGKKIARHLFDYVIKYGRENEYKSLFLTCLETAHSAHRLYESLGFEKMARVKYSMDL